MVKIHISCIELGVCARPWCRTHADWGQRIATRTAVLNHPLTPIEQEYHFTRGLHITSYSYKVIIR